MRTSAEIGPAVPRADLRPLALIVPGHAEPEHLTAMVARVEQHVRPPFTMYVVHDAETDSTAATARALAASRPWLRLLRNDGTPGIAGAVRAGFRVVRQGPTLVTMADAGDDLSIVPAMLALYREGYRVVCPSRFVSGGRQVGGSLVKRALLRASGLALRLLVGFPTHDLSNNFRLYDAGLVNELGIESTEGSEIALELTAKAFRRGARIAEVPVTWADRRVGRDTTPLGRWLRGYLRWYGYALCAGRRR